LVKGKRRRGRDGHVEAEDEPAARDGVERGRAVVHPLRADVDALARMAQVEPGVMKRGAAVKLLLMVLVPLLILVPILLVFVLRVMARRRER
jgi:hypothetical protein